MKFTQQLVDILKNDYGINICTDSSRRGMHEQTCIGIKCESIAFGIYQFFRSMHDLSQRILPSEIWSCVEEFWSCEDSAIFQETLDSGTIVYFPNITIESHN